jgi:hypothetical protein
MQHENPSEDKGKSEGGQEAIVKKDAGELGSDDACVVCRQIRYSRTANRGTEIRSTFVTLSPFTKGDAFRCQRATERRGSWCSAVELKSVLQQQSRISKGAKGKKEILPPPVSPSVRGTIEGLFFLRISFGKPAVRKHGVRTAGRGDSLPLYPPRRARLPQAPFACGGQGGQEKYSS